MQDEGELIRAAARGERAAFDALVRLKRERVVRVAYRITGDWEDALDVAQGVFIKLWNGLAQFDRERRFDTWVHRITVNAAIDLIRSKGPRGLFQQLPEDNQDLPSPERLDAGDEVDLGRLREAFTVLAAQLAPQQRAAFVMREIEGLSTNEVADAMGVAQSTVRNHVLQARRQLRERLLEHYPELVPESKRGSSGQGGPTQ